MARTRDTQRARCYKAEREVFTFYPGRVLRSAPGATLGDYKYGKAMAFQEMQDLQLLIGNSKKLVNKWRGSTTKRVRAEISGRRTRGGAASYGGKIQYSPKAMLDWIVCHEMAHELNDRTFGIHGDSEYGHASHGWRFCAIYIDVVRWVIGAEAAEALKASFKRNKVRFTPPVKRTASKKPPTPAQMEARAAFVRRRADALAEKKWKSQVDRRNAQIRYFLRDAERWGIEMTLAEAEAKATAQGF